MCIIKNLYFGLADTTVYIIFITNLDILVSLLDSAPELQNRVSVLCEGWWCAGREGREVLMPNTLLYVVARTLTEGATVSFQPLNNIFNYQ